MIAGTPARHRFHWRCAPGPCPNGSCPNGEERGTPPERPIPKQRRARGTAPIAALHILWTAVKAGTRERHRFHGRPAPGQGLNGNCQSGVAAGCRLLAALQKSGVRCRLATRIPISLLPPRPPVHIRTTIRPESDLPFVLLALFCGESFPNAFPGRQVGWSCPCPNPFRAFSASGRGRGRDLGLPRFARSAQAMVWRAFSAGLFYPLQSDKVQGPARNPIPKRRGGGVPPSRRTLKIWSAVAKPNGTKIRAFSGVLLGFFDVDQEGC